MPHLCGARQLLHESSDEEEGREAADRHPMTHDRAKVVNELPDSGFKKLLSVILKSAAEELVADLSNKTEEGKIKKGRSWQCSCWSLYFSTLGDATSLQLVACGRHFSTLCPSFFAVV